MKKHHTKDKGDIGVLKAAADLADKGYLIFNPLTEHAPFDLVAYKDSKFLRIQVKYREEKKGVLTIHLCSSWNDKKGNHKNQLDKSEVDILCVYCPSTGLCYYFNPTDFNKSVSLRIQPTKNNNKKRVNFASNYLNIPVKTEES